MNDVLDKQIEDLTQEAASIRNLREKFLLLAECGDRAAVQHVRELEAREIAARARIKHLHLHRLPLA
jgi:hypothetical protein